ncbi:MAG TPA: penicillin acylase family protein [Burkholderiales bacterium]|nr:penicillin acylase family protein [Burkholderiales bacterium]
MRMLLRLAFAALIVAVVVAAVLYFHLRRSLPQETGEARLAGLAKPVEILRDRFGVPHIFAQGLADATRALGYVHAQDRLWQMEMNRRTAAGRLAEVLGAQALEADRFLRTLGVRRAALANFARLDKQTQELLESYAAGVNAFLATDPVLPIEFWLTGVKPEPWTPADSLGWIKMMAWDLGGNWRNELLRLRLAKTMPLERIHELLPPYPGEKYPPIVELQRFYQGLEQEGVKLANRDSPYFSHLQMRKMGTVPIYGQGEGLGSNNWVVSGKRTATGKPLLANDPHLGLTAPAVWYFAHVKTPEFEAIGGTLPGVPAIVLGRNTHFAWGFTNTGPDVQDLYLERLDGAGNYLTPEGPRAFEHVDEVIRVKGGEDVRLQVRVSRHGPVISDVLPAAQAAAPRGHVLALQWTALREDDLTMQSALKIARAQDWAGFLGALRDFHSPQQNVVYADTAGNIGFVAAGRVPLRKPGNDLMGLAPAPGWLAKYDWAGFVPFAELPHAYNPASGQVVTANHRVTPPGYAHHITSEWQSPYRAQRIEELLRAVPAHNVGSFARIQGDVVSLPAREVLPRLLETKPGSEDARRALQLLGAWDGTMAAERAEPLVFWAWWRELTRALYADEMGEAFRSQWLARAPFVMAVLEDRGGQARWCDDVRTSAVETCDALLARSLEAALADLRKRYGGDVSSWRWGAAHEARHEHRPFGRVHWLARWFDISVPSAGDAYTVNVGRNRMEDEARPFASVHAASLRALYDLEDLDRSLYIHSGGQSGNVLSTHYRSLTAAWARGDYMPMTVNRAQLEAAGASRLALNGDSP